ncbi:hypothetical protein [Kineococcus glutinatus]
MSSPGPGGPGATTPQLIAAAITELREAQRLFADEDWPDPQGG